MELSHLRCFLTVAETLHFSRAADKLNLSQPALSTQIRKLEEYLGVRLFERSRQKTSLTYSGTVYREEARRILAMASRAVQRAQLAAAGKIGMLRIGFISTAAAYIIPSLVSEFREAFPDVELELRHHLTAEQVSLLNDGQIDIGFLRIPLPEAGEIRTIPIHKESFKLFLPAAHVLAAKRELTLQDLNETEFVTYSKTNAPGFARSVTWRLQQADVHPSVFHEASDMYTLISLVSAGVGIAIAPASLVNYRLPDVIIRDIDGMGFSEVAMAYRADIEHPAALTFIRMARRIYLGETEPLS